MMIFNKTLVLFFLLIILCVNNVYASAWPRKPKEFFGLFEILDESNYFKTLMNNDDRNFYRTNSYKFYLEYGLTRKLTIGGYIKNYNFYSRYRYKNTEFIKKVNNDYYSNIFLLQNLYGKNDNFFSLQYSAYLPIKYEDISKDVNTIDTKYAFEFSILYGKDGKIDLDFLNINARYYLDMSLAYKLVNDINYDQITFQTTVGIRMNDSSSFNLHYEYQYYLDENLFDKKHNIYNYYEGYNMNQFKVSFNYKFLDNLSTELAYYKKFSKNNSTGLIFSFIFNI